MEERAASSGAKCTHQPDVSGQSERLNVVGPDGPRLARELIRRIPHAPIWTAPCGRVTASRSDPHSASPTCPFSAAGSVPPPLSPGCAILASMYTAATAIADDIQSRHPQAMAGQCAGSGTIAGCPRPMTEHYPATSAMSAVTRPPARPGSRYKPVPQQEWRWARQAPASVLGR